MRRGPKAKPSHLKVVEGTFRPDRSTMIEGPAIVPTKPKFLKGRAAKIWAEMVEKHPAWTEFQIAVLETYCGLKAEHEAGAEAMPTARIVELRRQAELLLAPRGKAEDVEKKKDPAEGYFAG